MNCLCIDFCFCISAWWIDLDGGKEVLSMHQVLLYLLRSNKPLVPEEEIADMLQWEQLDWQKYAEECKGMIVTNPGMVSLALLLCFNRKSLFFFFPLMLQGLLFCCCPEPWHCKNGSVPISLWHEKPHLLSPRAFVAIGAIVDKKLWCHSEVS